MSGMHRKAFFILVPFDQPNYLDSHQGPFKNDLRMRRYTIGLRACAREMEVGSGVGRSRRCDETLEKLDFLLGADLTEIISASSPRFEIYLRHLYF